MDFGLTLKEEIFGKPCNLFLYKATVKLNLFNSHTVEYPNHLSLKVMVWNYGFPKILTFENIRFSDIMKLKPFNFGKELYLE